MDDDQVDGAVPPARPPDPVRPWQRDTRADDEPRDDSPVADGESASAVTSGPRVLQPARPWLRRAARKPPPGSSDMSPDASGRPQNREPAQPWAGRPAPSHPDAVLQPMADRISRAAEPGPGTTRPRPRPAGDAAATSPPPSAAAVSIADEQSAPPSALRRAASWVFAQAPPRESGAGEPEAAAATPESAATEPKPAAPETEPPAPRRRPRPYPSRPGTDLPARLAAADAARPRTTGRPGREPRSGPGADDDAEGDRRPRRALSDKARRRVRRLVTFTVVVGLLVAAVLLLRAYVVAPYYIPSGSMEPTLHGCTNCNDDRVLVNKLAYHLHPVHRGDVVVFHRPPGWRATNEDTLIKRVIGLPGDKIVIRSGKVFVNGQRLEEPYLNKNCHPHTDSGTGRVGRYGPIPKGDVFVMGDNRCHSEDSRALGPVPQSDIIGRAFLIVWPLDRIHYL